jgi:hypothetical protein
MVQKNIWWLKTTIFDGLKTTIFHGKKKQKLYLMVKELYMMVKQKTKICFKQAKFDGKKHCIWW